MAKITIEQIKRAYVLGLMIERGDKTPAAARDELVAETGIKKSSAADYVRNIVHLLRGQLYHRTLNLQASTLYLEWIARDFGVERARDAANAVLQHVDYYAQLPRGGRQWDIEAVAKGYLLLAEPMTFAEHEAAASLALEQAFASSPDERQARLATAASKPSRRHVTVMVYNRNADVVVEVLVRADGSCEHCHREAPFSRDDGRPYLEVHHRIPLSEDGDDTVDNAIALCPNCHRDAHHGINRQRFRP
jgi:5-methylcytosine-specific restriction enzyme A